VDALAPRFSLDVAQPEDGGVHHCLFLLDDGRPLTWTCYGRHALASTQTMWTDRGEATRALVVAVDDWGTTLGSDEPDAPITLTSWAAADAVVRTGAQPESEPVALRALREALMSVAQDELAHVRQAEEECSGCPSEAYCQNTESCSTFGSDEKDCAVFRVCTPRHPAGSECMHDYECRSRGCSGRDELYGRCD
jgi:hypothetical protein